MKQDIKNYDSKGNLHGEYVIYYNNGNVFERGQYFHAEPDGYWEGYWMNNGLIEYKQNWNKGLRHGLNEWYKSNGNIWRFGKYKNGRRIGIWIE